MASTWQIGLKPRRWALSLASLAGVSPAKQGLAGGDLGTLARGWCQIPQYYYTWLYICTSTECMSMVLLSVITMMSSWVDSTVMHVTVQVALPILTRTGP
ncbi:hypothetical protein J3F84DRAFT_356158 [Trichoderma pleuroticola]